MILVSGALPPVLRCCCCLWLSAAAVLATAAKPTTTTTPLSSRAAGGAVREAALVGELVQEIDGDLWDLGMVAAAAAAGEGKEKKKGVGKWTELKIGEADVELAKDKFFPLCRRYLARVSEGIAEQNRGIPKASLEAQRNLTAVSMAARFALMCKEHGMKAKGCDDHASTLKGLVASGEMPVALAAPKKKVAGLDDDMFKKDPPTPATEGLVLAVPGGGKTSGGGLRATTMMMKGKQQKRAVKRGLLSQQKTLMQFLRKNTQLHHHQQYRQLPEGAEAAADGWCGSFFGDFFKVLKAEYELRKAVEVFLPELATDMEDAAKGVVEGRVGAPPPCAEEGLDPKTACVNQTHDPPGPCFTNATMLAATPCILVADATKAQAYFLPNCTKDYDETWGKRVKKATELLAEEQVKKLMPTVAQRFTDFCPLDFAGAVLEVVMPTTLGCASHASDLAGAMLALDGTSESWCAEFYLDHHAGLKAVAEAAAE